MSGSLNNVSFRDKRFYDPYTGDGILLDTGAVAVPRIHECGTVVLDQAWSYRNVCSPFWRAYFNLDAGAAVRMERALYPLHPGRLIIIPQEVRYDCISHQDVRHFWVHFSLEVEAPPIAPLDLPLDSVMLKIWHRLAIGAGSKVPVALRTLRHGCLAALVEALGRIEEAGMVGTVDPLRDLLFWFDANMASPPSLDEMAARSGMGRRSFIRWFRTQTGSTPASFMTRRRIREACRLLRFGTDSIEQIAETTGFANRHHFTRVFSSETGSGPSAFRKAI